MLPAQTPFASPVPGDHALPESAFMSSVSTDPRPSRRLRTPAFAAFAVAFGVALAAGCNSNPYGIGWNTAIPDTVVLYSLARPELNLPSAFSFHQRTSYRVEDPNATGSWDIAVDTRDGQIVLLPPEALNIATGAGIAVLPGITLEQATEAPKDTMLYDTKEPVPIQTGNVYVIRSGRSVGLYGTYCRYYSKLEPLDIDVANGTLTFRFDSNPGCNDRALVPKG